MRRLVVLLGLLATAVLAVVVFHDEPGTGRVTTAGSEPEPVAPRLGESSTGEQPAKDVAASGTGDESPPRRQPAEESKEKPKLRTTTFRVTADGRPVEGALVVLKHCGSSGRTDANGVLVIAHPGNAAAYAVRKVGYHTQSSYYPDEEVAVELVAGRTAQGRVVLAG